MQSPAYVGDASEMNSQLPSYIRNADQESSSWCIPPLETQHVYSLAKKSGEPWLSLSVISRAASPNVTPTFFQNGMVGGSLRLELEKGDGIDSIDISLTGQLIMAAHSSTNFLNMSHTLWSRENDSPDIARRIIGKHEWPYSFRLPKGVNILSHISVDGGVWDCFRLPPSLFDQTLSVNVAYRLTVRVHRRYLRGRSKLIVPIQFTPLSRPSPPSISRQIAYVVDTPLVGVEDDPEGWKTLPSVTIQGTIFKTISVEVSCTLSLAKPLCYTRGTPLPLMMVMESADSQALNLLSTNIAITVRLVQRTCFGSNRPQDLVPGKPHSRQSMAVKTRELQTAVWRPFAEVTGHSKRVLVGEIHIPEGIPPACHILQYRLEHIVVFESLRAVGFVPTRCRKDPLISEPVEIVTEYAQGPRPRAYLPPGYSGDLGKQRRSRMGNCLLWTSFVA